VTNWSPGSGSIIQNYGSKAIRNIYCTDPEH
jgi:hypothetical protein